MSYQTELDQPKWWHIKIFGVK